MKKSASLKCAFILAASSTFAFADLGIMDTPSETTAKNGAASAGITQVYDHPDQSPNGQFVVPVQYNRTNAEGNGAEHDPNNSKKNDIDYVPLSQLKGAAGTNGADGAVGNTGANGSKGDTGETGQKGDKGDKGEPGDNGEHRLTVNIGAEVRWYDWKHVAVASGYRYDVNHHSHTVDAVIFQIKLGRSYEDRRLDALQKKLDRLERLLK